MKPYLMFSGRRHVSTTRGQRKFSFDDDSPKFDSSAPFMNRYRYALYGLCACQWQHVQVYVSRHGLGRSGQVRSGRAAPAHGAALPQSGWPLARPAMFDAGAMRMGGSSTSRYVRTGGMLASRRSRSYGASGLRLEAGFGASAGARLQVSALRVGFLPFNGRGVGACQ